MTRFILIVAILVFGAVQSRSAHNAQVNVTQKNNNPSRDGLYIDPRVYAWQCCQSGP